jgi:hypothetical protein
MDEEGPADAIVPLVWHGIEVLRFGWMTVYAWWRFRFIWYDPRDREHWTFGGVFHEDAWQVELGPVVLVYVRSEDY